MQQRDIIIDQIEQAGKVLGKIISEFLNLKSKGNISEAIILSQKQLSEEMDLNIDELVSMSESEFNDHLSNTVMTDRHLELLSSYLEEIGKSYITSYPELAQEYLNKAIQSLELADTVSETLSFPRKTKKSRLAIILNTLTHEK